MLGDSPKSSPSLHYGGSHAESAGLEGMLDETSFTSLARGFDGGFGTDDDDDDDDLIPEEEDERGFAKKKRSTEKERLLRLTVSELSFPSNFLPLGSRILII